MEGYITPQEAADELGLTVYRVHQLIRAEKLPAQKFGRFYLIAKADLGLLADRKPGRPKNEPEPIVETKKVKKK